MEETAAEPAAASELLALITGLPPFVETSLAGCRSRALACLVCSRSEQPCQGLHVVLLILYKSEGQMQRPE